MKRSCEELVAEHPEYADMIQAWAARSEEMLAGLVPGTAEIPEPATTLMIDDSPANLATASPLGMPVFRFESAPRPRSFLEKEGLLGERSPGPIDTA